MEISNEAVVFTAPIRSSAPVRTRTKLAAGRSSPQKQVEKEEPPVVPAMNIKEQMEDGIPGATATPPEDTLGRWLSFKALSESAASPELYEIHLGITSNPLKSVPSPIPLLSSGPSAAQRRSKRDNPARSEARDLQTLKAFSNEILEIQHEIYLFGSLKVIDQYLPLSSKSFVDLANRLTSLDISHNALTSIPTNLFTFTELTYLDVSHNLFTSLPFNEPFTSGRKFGPTSRGFTPSTNRADSPLPRLATLHAFHNKLSADAIDLVLPSSLVKVDL
ncbi:hypothetical protein D9758_008176 [Tetrapyrgos nigripes]|uniref:Uncharacterized protein n=1 Tax=Tetrapyrgos nigripes TaxID=182062 RepID=A0A8H5GHQ3_9AGAR|nr:hypothetical protein D9758_008176 [Tetrapyrgos nigripes]